MAITFAIELINGQPMLLNWAVPLTPYLPKYVLTDERITVEAFAQYVIHDKHSLTLNGYANITLNEGAEIIL
jgi:hypothetical protein